jgi:hypothetical protein
MMRLSCLLTAALVLAGCGRTSTPTNELDVEQTLNATYTSISDVVELRDGRVAFTDPRARVFLIGDFAAGTVDSVGTAVDSLGAGAPPENYRIPGWVARLGGDSVALVDFASTRTTLWTPAGFARAVRFPEAGGLTPVLVYDTVGHGYKIDFRTVLGGAEPGTTMLSDSLVVLRLALDGTTVDTVARMSPPLFGEARFGEQVQRVARIFGPADAFGVLPDGTVWVARASTHTVDWRAPDGTWTMGTPHDWDRVPVGQKDRDQVMERLRARGLPQGVEVKYPFADYKPSFEQALTRDTGEAWLLYSRSDADAPTRYAVFGRDGKLAREVTLPAGVTLSGFGPGKYAYGSQKQPDGSRRVVRMVLE